MSSDLVLSGQLPVSYTKGLPSQSELDIIMSLGEMFYKSGIVKDATSAAAVVGKIMFGYSIGATLMESVMGIYLIPSGKGVTVALSYTLIASRIKSHPKYDYAVNEHTDKVCRITFYEGTRELGVSSFSMEEAAKAGLTGKSGPWQSFPKNMLFARAMSNGAKQYCPDVFGMPVYTPDEVGAEVDADGSPIIEHQARSAASYAETLSTHQVDSEPSTPSQGELVIRIKPAKNGSRSYSCRAEVPAGEKGEMQMEWVSCFGSDLFHAAGYDTDTWPKPSEGENTVNFRLIPTPVLIAAKNGNYWNITKVIHPEDRASAEQIVTIDELGGRVYGAAWLDGDSDSNSTSYRVWAAIKASNDNRGKPWRVRELNELTEDEADSVIETLQAKLEKPAQPKAKTTTAPSAGKTAKATTMHVLDETAASLYGEASLDQLEILVKQFGTDTTINTLTEEQAQELIAHIAAQLKEGEPDTPAHDEMASTTELSTEAWIALQQLCAHYGTPDVDALDELIAFGYVEDDITEAGFKLLLSRYGANDKNNYEDFLLGLNIPSAEANKIWRGNTAGHEAGKMQTNPGIGYKNGFLGAMCLISLKRMEEGA